jgi:hypothetical protein
VALRRSSIVEGSLMRAMDVSSVMWCDVVVGSPMLDVGLDEGSAEWAGWREEAIERWTIRDHTYRRERIASNTFMSDSGIEG